LLFFLWVFILGSTPTHTPITYSHHLRGTTKIKHIYLNHQQNILLVFTKFTLTVVQDY
jgi:hypothetical protein